VSTAEAHVGGCLRSGGAGAGPALLGVAASDPGGGRSDGAGADPALREVVPSDQGGQRGWPGGGVGAG